MHVDSTLSDPTTTNTNLVNKYDTVYYQVYKQIDFIKKFKLNTDMTTKEKEDQLTECKKAYDDLNQSFANLKVKILKVFKFVKKKNLRIIFVFNS